MTPTERAAADRLRAWLSTQWEAGHRYRDDLRGVLDALDRHERLANEGLTEDEKIDLEEVESWTRFMPAARSAIAKLQAQLADALTFRDIFIGNGWGDDMRAQTVEYETAKAALRFMEENAGLLRSPIWSNWDAAMNSFRRRFNIADQQAGGDPVCKQCNGMRHISDTYPMEFGGQRTVSRPCPECNQTRNTEPRPEPQYILVCSHCGGTGITGHCGDYGQYIIPCRNCGGNDMIGAGSGRVPAAQAEHRDRHIEERTP